jgi:hypothetical protein
MMHMPHHFENDLDLGQAAALRAMQYLNCPSDISSRTIFKVLSAPGEQDALRDLEPLLGVFVRHTNTCDVVVIKDDLAAIFSTQQWHAVQRGGYLLDLLWAFGDHRDDLQPLLLPWMDVFSESLPHDLPKIPFFPNDQRQVKGDCLIDRWRLSSGVLYDRLKQMRRPPYVC